METLAWNPRYLGRIGIILAKLAKIDPGGKESNKPINSLTEIFLAWHPGTSANLGQRLQALDLILEREHEIGWDLLSSLLPRLHQSSFPTQEPIWRDFGRSQKEVLTRKLVWETYQNYVNRAILHAGTHPDRWKILINIYNEVSDTHQKAIENELEKLSESSISQKERKTIWEALRTFINRHKEFPDASWTLPLDRLERLEVVKQLFEPADLLDRVAWLFNNYFPDIPFPKTDLDAADDKLTKLRYEAIKAVWQQGQLTLLKKMVNRVSRPGLIPTQLLEFLDDINIVMELVEQTNQGSENEQFFARCLSGGAYHRFGNKWTQLLLSKAKDLRWTSDGVVNILLNYPDTKMVFDLVKSLGAEIERVYWIKKPGWFHCEDNEALVYAIKKLKENGRALDAIVLAQRKWKTKDIAFIFELLDQALKELNEVRKPEIVGDVGYWIEKLFDWLRLQEDADKSELARREYAYLPLLTGPAREKDLTLHEILATDPGFFVQVLCDLYKPATISSEDFEPSKESRLRAKFAWKLMNSWKCPPGVESNGEVSGVKLRKWVQEARELATKKDRIEIADQEIGKVLFHFPNDPDDSLWPHVELRKLLEDLQNKNIETGIEVEQSNSRGVTTRAMFEGGAQERALAQKWHGKSEKMGLRWPRTKAMLERIASSWEAHAKWEDDEAAKDRLSF